MGEQIEGTQMLKFPTGRREGSKVAGERDWIARHIDHLAGGAARQSLHDFSPRTGPGWIEHHAGARVDGGAPQKLLNPSRDRTSACVLPKILPGKLGSPSGRLNRHHLALRPNCIEQGDAQQANATIQIHLLRVWVKQLSSKRLGNCALQGLGCRNMHLPKSFLGDSKLTPVHELADACPMVRLLSWASDERALITCRSGEEIDALSTRNPQIPGIARRDRGGGKRMARYRHHLMRTSRSRAWNAISIHMQAHPAAPLHARFNCLNHHRVAVVMGGKTTQSVTDHFGFECSLPFESHKAQIGTARPPLRGTLNPRLRPDMGDPIRGSLTHIHGDRSGEAVLLLDHLGDHRLTRYRIGDKHHPPRIACHTEATVGERVNVQGQPSHPSSVSAPAVRAGVGARGE